MLRTLNEAVEKQPSPKTQPPAANIASSFNGRTADSDSAYRGSNPWEATNTCQSRTSSYPPRLPKCVKLPVYQQLIGELRPRWCESIQRQPDYYVGKDVG